MLKSGLYLFSAVAVVAIVQGSKTTPVLAVFGNDWHEECQSEAPCSEEELSEIDGSYTSECLDEGCSTEELNELAGGQQYIDPMLENLLGNGYVVATGDFQSSTSPPADQVWWYTGCNYTGLVTAIFGDVGTMPNGFNEQSLGLQIGAGMANVLAFVDENNAGASQTFVTNVQCLSSSYPAFANTISSACVQSACVQQ